MKCIGRPPLDQAQIDIAAVGGIAARWAALATRIPDREPRFFVPPTAIAETSSRFCIVDSEALAGCVPSRAQVRFRFV